MPFRFIYFLEYTFFLYDHFATVHIWREINWKQQKWQ